MGGKVKCSRLLAAGGLFLVLVGLILATPARAKGPRQIGGVSRIQSEAVAEQGGRNRTLVQGGPVYEGDVLRTGAGARLEMQFLDGTILTMSEDTAFSLDAYALDGDRRRGDVAFQLFSGAFRTVTGITVSDAVHMQVKTPLATIGIRGTDFWGGWLNVHGFGVLMLSGKTVTITNRAGTATIDKPGYGVSVMAPDEPIDDPIPWAQPKLFMALDTVTFGPGGQGQ